MKTWSAISIMVGAALMAASCTIFTGRPTAGKLEPETYEPGATQTFDGIEFVWIPAGSFMMGSRLSPEAVVWRYGTEVRHFVDEHPLHEVSFSSGFWMSKYEVTNAQYRRFEPDHNSNGPDYDGLNGDNQPVAYVTWSDATVFCRWLSERSSVPYRLPTEAEWEYACRAGTDGVRYWGDNDASMGRYENVYDRTAKAAALPGDTRDSADTTDGYVVSAPVGSFKPNPWGLYDMLGNIRELCSDWYGKDYYAHSAATDPRGPGTSWSRVMRGGMWRSNPSSCRASSRITNKAGPTFKNKTLGFRICWSADKPLRGQQDNLATMLAEKGPGIEIEAFIDCASAFCLAADGFYWKCNGPYAKVGRHEGQNEPTYVNGEPWWPQWRSPENETGADQSEKVKIAIGETSGLRWELIAVGPSRGGENIERRSPASATYENGKFAVFFPDKDGGPRWYRFRIYRSTEEAATKTRSPSISGRVGDGAGEPVEGVKIKAASGDSRAETVSGQDGSYRLTDLQGGGKYGLDVSRESYYGGSASVSVPVDGNVRNMDFTLGTGTHLTGRLVESSGQPVSEARMYIFPALGKKGAAQVGPLKMSMRWTQTNATGKFEFKHVGPGMYSVQVYWKRDTGGGHFYLDAEEFWLTVEPDQAAADVEIVIPAFDTKAIEGHVRDAEGKGIAGATVSAMGWRDYSRSGTKTDETGRYRIEGIAGNAADTVWFRRKGYANAELKNVAVGTKNADVTMSVAK